MFEGLTGALSNMFSGGVTSGLTNLGQAANLIGKASQGNVTKEDQAAWKGLMSTSGGASNPTGNTNFDISEGITGKGISSYFSPSTQSNKAGEFDIAKPTTDTSPRGSGQAIDANKTAGQQAADKAKEGFTLEKFNKILKAMQVATTKKAAPPPIPGVSRGSATRLTDVRGQGFVNPLAARDSKEIYSAPSYQTRWKGY